MSLPCNDVLIERFPVPRLIVTRIHDDIINHAIGYARPPAVTSFLDAE